MLNLVIALVLSTNGYSFRLPHSVDTLPECSAKTEGRSWVLVPAEGDTIYYMICKKGEWVPNGTNKD